ncbi:MAG TPA: ATP-binding protein [Allosphingosinicella sp.]
MRRLGRAPLLVQVLALVAAVAILAQLISLAALLVMPSPREPFDFADVAAALRSGATVEREGERLIVRTVASPPESWALDDEEERRSRATLAALLGLPYERVLVEKELPIPGGSILVRMNSPALTGPAPPPEPYEQGGEVTFYDMRAAARRPDGRWTVVGTPPFWAAPLSLLAVWLTAGLLLLLPLAWAFTRRLVAPIRAFAETAERAGRGDRDCRFAAEGPSEVRKAAQALDEMQLRIAGAVEERTNLIAAIAHDLRAPLARLRFKVEDLPGGQRDPIVRDLERMDRMIAGVLAFVRGEGPAERRLIDLAALVESLVDDLAASGADVAVGSAEPAEVLGDPLALRRLVGNLLDNAVKYGGGARCQVLSRDGKAVILVDDDGPGIAEDSLERMFTPFVRGDSARDPATGGVGLGLAIARAIARSHGGDVLLSARPKRGLRARVELPSAAGPASPRSPGSPSGSAAA